jgi:hypothetical protein
MPAPTDKPTDDQMHKETIALINNLNILILNTPCMYTSS